MTKWCARVRAFFARLKAAETAERRMVNARLDALWRTMEAQPSGSISSHPPSAPAPLETAVSAPLIKEPPPMSILSQTVFDPIKAQLGSAVEPALDNLAADLSAATQKFASSLPTSVPGQTGAIALNTLAGLVALLAPSLIHAELLKVAPSFATTPSQPQQPAA
jgi:hypothetical protein